LSWGRGGRCRGSRMVVSPPYCPQYSSGNRTKDRQVDRLYNRLLWREEACTVAQVPAEWLLGAVVAPAEGVWAGGGGRGGRGARLVRPGVAGEPVGWPEVPASAVLPRVHVAPEPALRVRAPAVALDLARGVLEGEGGGGALAPAVHCQGRRLLLRLGVKLERGDTSQQADQQDQGLHHITPHSDSSCSQTLSFSRPSGTPELHLASPVYRRWPRQPGLAGHPAY